MKELFENQLVQEILKNVMEKGITVELKTCQVKSGLGEQLYNSFSIDGFYKSGEVNIFVKEGKVYALARYDEVEEITSFGDLLRINLRWWDRSKDRFDGWKVPSTGWDKLLLEAGLVKKKVKEEFVLA